MYKATILHVVFYGDNMCDNTALNAMLCVYQWLRQAQTALMNSYKTNIISNYRHDAYVVWLKG